MRFSSIIMRKILNSAISPDDCHSNIADARAVGIMAFEMSLHMVTYDF